MAEYNLASLGWKDSEGKRHIIHFTEGKRHIIHFTESADPKPGSLGYGTGVYKGDDLEESLGLFPMEGTYNSSHDNYGNYQNSDGSIFCFIPKFYYTFNCKPEETYYQDTLTYSGLTAEQLAQIVTRSPLNYMAFAPSNAFENEAEANAHGFILHRAFIDGGKEKSGFFIMKYLASKGTNGTSDKALSVKNGHTISLCTMDYPIPSSTMPNCNGNGKDAIILSKAINSNLNCASAFMYSALAMQSKFIGTIVTSTNQCAWYDPNLVMNYPKGCNNGSLGDFNDSSVSYTAASNKNTKPKTGSGTPFNKTTHNGLNNGVCDLNGCIWQAVTGVGWNTTRVLKESSKLSDIEPSTVDNQSAPYYDTGISWSNSSAHWGSSTFGVSWRKSSSGSNRALEGVYPPGYKSGASIGGTNEFGKDFCRIHVTYSAVVCSGNWANEDDAGIFDRDHSNWTDSYSSWGFRSGGYALN